MQERLKKKAPNKSPAPCQVLGRDLEDESRSQLNREGPTDRWPKARTIERVRLQEAGYAGCRVEAETVRQRKVLVVEQVVEINVGAEPHVLAELEVLGGTEVNVKETATALFD